MTDPLVTIVTPTLNCAATIATAIESVTRQDPGFAVEHIVVDGGSTDGTREIASSHAGVTLMVETDRNLYDALNRGISLARGAIVGLLNGDDAYRPGALAAAAAALADAPRAALACGGAEVLLPDGRTARTHRPPTGHRLEPEDLVRGVPIINARFFRSALFNRIGLFDLRYPVAADREWLLRVAFSGADTVAIPRIVYTYVQHPASLSMGGWPSRARIAADHMAIAEDWLASRDGLEGAAAALLEELHAHGALLGTLTGVARGEWRDAWACAARGMSMTPAWPARAAAIAADRAARRIAGTWGSRE